MLRIVPQCKTQSHDSACWVSEWWRSEGKAYCKYGWPTIWHIYTTARHHSRDSSREHISHTRGGILPSFAWHVRLSSDVYICCCFFILGCTARCALLFFCRGLCVWCFFFVGYGGGAAILSVRGVAELRIRTRCALRLTACGSAAFPAVGMRWCYRGISRWGRRKQHEEV